jgi:membrane protein
MNRLRIIVSLLKETAQEWAEDKAPRLGAALAYYAIFSMAPLLIIVILIAGSVFGQVEVQQRVVAELSTVIGPTGAQTVSRMIDNLRLSPEAGWLTTAVGVGALLMGAVGAFVQLQDAFDTIWEVAPRPAGILAFLKNRAIGFGMVLVIGFILLVTLIVNAMWSAASDYLGRIVPYFGLINTLVNFVIPPVLAAVLFAIMFKVLPSVHIAWRDVWPGAILTAVLFTLGQLAIGFYLGNSNIGTAAGAAGSLLVLLVWIYYSAQILFFGVEFTQVYVRRFGRQRPVVNELAMPLTEEARAEQGIPHAEHLARRSAEDAAIRRGRWHPRRLAGSVVRRVVVVRDYTGALVGFAAGLGAGIMLALRTTRSDNRPGS